MGTFKTPAIIACSGGTDSSALVVLASEARIRGRAAAFIVVHVDHRSRADSGSEADFVRQVCRDLGVPFVPAVVLESGSVPGRSLEDVWRERRYAALADVAARLRIATVATAHTRDDQVETVLMRTLSGSAKLTIQPSIHIDSSRGALAIFRPLLGSSRSELKEVLDLAGVKPLQDPSNDDVSYRRNAVRHHLLPVLDKVFPGFDSALLRSASLRESDAAYCDAVSEAELSKIMHYRDDDCLELDKRQLLALHPAIASRVVLLAARALIMDPDNREMSFERVHSVLGAASGRSGAIIELPYGVRLEVLRDALRFRIETKGPSSD